MGFSGWKLGEKEKRLRKRCVSNTSSRELDNNYRFFFNAFFPRPILNSFFFASPIVAGISFKKKTFDQQTNGKLFSDARAKKFLNCLKLYVLH
jgi:hypothetical protein